MKTGLLVGSFDPFTNGHLYLVEQAIKLCDKLIIGIGINENKTRKYNINEMKNAIKNVCLNNFKNANIEVVTYNCLTGELAKKTNATFMFRGLRNIEDFKYEEEIANFNAKNFNLNTIYIRAKENLLVSSSYVNSLINKNKSIEDLVPKEINDLIMRNKKGKHNVK